MKRGEVVLVDWQFSDRSGCKLRPAIVDQADFLNGPIDDAILEQVSPGRSTTSPDGRQSELTDSPPAGVTSDQ